MYTKLQAGNFASIRLPGNDGTVPVARKEGTLRSSTITRHELILTAHEWVTMYLLWQQLTKHPSPVSGNPSKKKEVNREVVQYKVVPVCL